MGRSGVPAGSSKKGKEKAESSRPSKTRAAKKSKRTLRDEDSEEEDPMWQDESVEEQVDRRQRMAQGRIDPSQQRFLPPSIKPIRNKRPPLTLTINFPRVRGQPQRAPVSLEWTKGRLSSMEEEHRPLWFNAKINQLGDRKDAFLLEKQVVLDDFRPFGLIKMFEDIGWEAILNVYDGETENTYMDPIQEWVSTLVYTRGDNHPQDDTLVGTVGGQAVIMSYVTLGAIANFDSKRITYSHPGFEVMYRSAGQQPMFSQQEALLYEPDVGEEGVGIRSSLRIPVRILLLFICKNVMPRRSDLAKVRDPEVQVLHSLLTGRNPISLRYLIMSNIWDARESREKAHIPHVRLITALMKSQNVNLARYQKTKRRQAMEPYSGPSLSAHGWIYSTSRRHVKLEHKDNRRVWKVVKLGMEQAESDDESMSSGGDIGYRMPADQGPMGGSFQQPSFHPHMPYQGHSYSAGGLFDYGQIVESSRPAEYTQWDSYQQRCWDRDVESNARTSREQREWNHTHEYSFQTEINMRYLDDQQRRMRDQYNRGEEVQLHVPRVNFATLPRNTTNEWYPEPESHHSAWIDPYQQYQQWEEHSRVRQEQAQQGEGSSAAEGAFSMGGFIENLNNIFGPPGQYYYNP